jgi:hypothetical protein
MYRTTFIIAMRNDYWSIGYNQHWYGRYPNLKTAEEATIAIARELGEIPTRIVVRNTDGTELLVWDSELLA